jgi:hypothetical protein
MVFIISRDFATGKYYTRETSCIQRITFLITCCNILLCKELNAITEMGI